MVNNSIHHFLVAVCLSLLATGNMHAQTFWAKDLGGPGNDHVTDVKTDGAGNIYATGEFSGSIVFGGTTYVSTAGIDMFLAKGALVLEPNYRGSAGYGEKFRSLNVRNLGIGDAWDVLSGIDALVQQGIVNRDRVGSMGWSQGGYISAFLTTRHSDRFKAISVGAGISDWMTYYVNTDIHPFTRQYLKATPWDDPKIYADTSPMTYIKQARTPTLIQHGDQDARVPIPNAFQLYQGLRDQHVPVQLSIFKGFGHGINKPKANRAAMQQNLDWFSRYLWNQPAGTQR